MDHRIGRLFPDTPNEPYRHWVVIGYGRVTRGPGPHSNRIELVIAPLNNADSRSFKWAGNADLALERVASVQLPVGLLGLVSVGDIWHRGLRIARLEFTLQSWRLRFIPDRMTFVSAGHTKVDGDDQRWLIPSDSYPLGALVPRAQITAISDGNYPFRILIPSICLLSFYFGGSSDLYRSIFRAGFGQPSNPAFDPSLSAIDGDDLHLYLRQGIPFEDARIVAPWTTDYGIKQVARIYESGLVARDGQDGYPRVLPPYAGDETLTMEGIVIAEGTQYERFLALRLIKGSLPIPYRRILVVNPELAEKVTGEPEDDPGEPPPLGSPGKQKAKTAIEIRSGELPGSGPSQTIRLQMAERFSDNPEVVRAKQTVPRKPKPGKYEGSADREDEPKEPTTGSVGDADHGTSRRTIIKTSSTRPAQEPLKRAPRMARSHSFNELHDCLATLDCVLDRPHDILVLPGFNADDGDPCASLFPTKHDKVDAYHAWYYRQSSRLRRRKVLVGAALYRRFWFTLLEPEQKPHEQFQLAIALSGASTPRAEALISIAAAAAANNCIWPEGRIHGLEVRRQKHTWTSPSEFVSTVSGLFDVMLNQAD